MKRERGARRKREREQERRDNKEKEKRKGGEREERKRSCWKKRKTNEILLKEKMLLQPPFIPSIIIETNMIKGVFQYLNFSQLIINSFFLTPTFNHENF